jgi:Holliday junction resolvase RusA-like endonuclease
MRLLASFFVPGVPKAQGSKKIVRGNRAVSLGHARAKHGAYWIDPAGIWPAMMIEAVKGLKQWRRCVSDYARAKGVRVEGAVVLSAVFVFERPASHLTGSGKLRKGAPIAKTSKPDTGKLVRAIEDALTDAGVWSDDSQVTGYRNIEKRYGTQSGAHIAIYQAPTENAQQPLDAAWNNS